MSMTTDAAPNESQESPLRFLTAHDRARLLERADSFRVTAGEVIIEEGSLRKALFVIRTGSVQVQRRHGGEDIVYARMGPEQILGEMSFLEGTGASASVVAAEDTELDVVEWAYLRRLLVTAPAFAARFYQSLAVAVSERLRETAALLPPLMVEEVPQVSRFHAARAATAARDEVPPSLVAAVELFKTELLSADRCLKDGLLDDGQAHELISAACTALNRALADNVRDSGGGHEGAVGAYVFRETFPYFMQSAMGDRSFSKPRGYAGDYATIEMLYDNEPRGAGRLGPFIDRWVQDLHPARAVRNRRGMMTDTIRRIAAQALDGRRTLITSLASGPARELIDLFAEGDPPDIHATCIDIDPEALAYAAGRARELGIDDHFTFARDNVIRMSMGTGRVDVPQQRLIYSLGLIDYLTDDLVLPLLNWMYDHLEPQGMALIGNFAPSNPDKPFMDHILEWPLIHRSAHHLRSLFGSSRFAGAPVEVVAEDAGVQLFASCTKVQGFGGTSRLGLAGTSS